MSTFVSVKTSSVDKGIVGELEYEADTWKNLTFWKGM